MFKKLSFAKDIKRAEKKYINNSYNKKQIKNNNK